MTTQKASKTASYPLQVTTRKVQDPADVVLTIPDSLAAWIRVDLALAVHGVRSDQVTQKITLHLDRFRAFVAAAYGHDRISTVLKRDVVAQAPRAFALGDPTKGIGELGLPTLEPRALSLDQIVSLKNLCDRLPRLHQKRGRRWATAAGEIPVRERSRPSRDRAIVFVLLSTGLRREELVELDLDQVEPSTPRALREARLALADCLEKERSGDAEEGIPARSDDGRLSVRAINQILGQIGRWHDAEVHDPARRVSLLRPHDLCHTFAFQLARVTGTDAYELERRLGHRSQRFIIRYTNRPEPVAAGHVETF